MSALESWDDDTDVNDDVDQLDETDDEHEQELYLGSVDEFVREIVVPTFRRRVGDRSPFRWDGRWWAYPEAVLRLEAMWRAWEYLRLDPSTGISVWIRDHADPHLGVLMSDYGPFAKSKDVTDHGDPLPYVAPPDGMFPDQRTAATDPGDVVDHDQGPPAT